MTASVAPRVTASPESVPIGRAGLAAITFSENGGGVAYVARLLRRAIADASDVEPLMISLGHGHAGTVPPWRAARFAARVIASNAFRRVDWMMYGHPGIASVQRMLPAALRRPYAVQLHGTDAWEREPSVGVREATIRIAPSRYTRERALAAFPALGEVVVCPHGLLPDSALREEAPDSALLARVGSASALIVGRLLSAERRKGHDQLLECWRAVTAAVPGTQLVIAGDGDDTERLRRKAADLGIADDVLFAGYVSDATREALLARCSVFAMPSRQEGFGLVYLEAMRAGIPCIGAVDDGASEPIVHGETGFLVEQSSPEELAASLVMLLSNVDLARRFGAAGRARFEEHFTFDRYRERLLAILRTHFGRARA